jgi:general secretion pathway protein E
MDIIDASVESSAVALRAKMKAPVEIADHVLLIDESTIIAREGWARHDRVRSYAALVERTQNSTVNITTLNDADFERRVGTLSGVSAVTTGPRDVAAISTMQEEVLSIIRRAKLKRASDIHFVNRSHKSTLRFRVDGVLQDEDRMDVRHAVDLCQTIYGSMLDQGQSEYKEKVRQDGRVDRKFSGKLGLTGIRVATRPLEDHNIFVMRLQSTGSANRQTLAGLGYTDQHIRDFHKMMIRDGVNLLSGSTGSGKTTTLSVIGRLLLEMFQGNVNLMTVEDPVEIEMRYDFGEAVQTPLGFKETWAQAIENLMRMDPDIMFIGEIRELLAALAAIQGAMTGHGLWTTTHAKHAWASLDRLGDLNVPIARLSDASLFTGLVNQSLAPMLCQEPGCAKPFEGFSHLLRADIRERVKDRCKTDSVRLAAEPNPDCPRCGGLGYYERTVVAEVIVPTQRLLDVYRSDGSSSRARSEWIHHGGRTALDHLIQKIDAGLIDPAMGEAALRRPLDEDALTTA